MTEADIQSATERWNSLPEHTPRDDIQELLICNRKHYDISGLARIISGAASDSPSTSTPLAPEDERALAKRAADLGFSVIARPDKTKRPEPVFGHIPGVVEQHLFPTRYDAHLLGVHRALQAGIVGTRKEGAESIVVSGGYEDDEDQGHTIIYTGHGGQDERKRQIRHQSFDDPGNAALQTSTFTGRPVRVVRRANASNGSASGSGYSYAGLFVVEESWHAPGLRGFEMCRFRLVKLQEPDASAPAPEAPAEQAPVGTRTPGRRRRTSDEVSRLSAVRRYVLAAYDYTCQACRGELLINGTPYAEGAHIRGVGAPHHGPDEIDNMLCLCPNCHVQLDKGALFIEADLTVVRNGVREAKLHTVASCLPAAEHLEYHRARKSPPPANPD
ncbi:YDG/SRA domain-containing protein [Saccharopolyspora sp. 7B]|uniref:YDG/SRA domain-containing protein n=1 Tax=Saccharopolyspora sp. 7B TaxID=2877240 RepID=UPI001CD2BEEC|nr:YDG/SRA domain-containing protein [Saccharopolyspora sp. 7B]MCA1278927.1 HNH endonuclease [Saccharopolyspora sp. 7B]